MLCKRRRQRSTADCLALLGSHDGAKEKDTLSSLVKIVTKNCVSLSHKINRIQMGKFGATEIIIILAIILLLFGGRKIPELMKGLGRGVKEFKDGVKGDGEETKKEEGK